MGNQTSVSQSGFNSAPGNAVQQIGLPSPVNRINWTGGGTDLGGWFKSSDMIGPYSAAPPTQAKEYLDPDLSSGFDQIVSNLTGSNGRTTIGTDNNGLGVAANQNPYGKQFPYNSPEVVNQLNSGKKLKRILYPITNPNYL